MLTLKCISTGSNGNCYLLKYDKKTLILDLGIKYRSLLVNLEDVRYVHGAVITHEHKDHDFLNGDILTSQMINSFTSIISYKNSKPNEIYQLGKFKIIPVEHKHNVKCYGYLIKIENEVIYYATDMQYPIQFDNLKVDHFIIECNYIDSLRDSQLLTQNANTIHLSGIAENHCSLETLIQYFSKLEYKPKNILTIHSSNSNLFSRDIVENELKKFADNVKVVFNNKEYVLKGDNFENF